jgi:hypothetical protein
MELLNSLDPLLRSFWYVAIPASLIFIIQTLMTFIGADATDGVDADFDSNLEGTEAPFQLFSLRNMINFLLGFSWSGISFYGLISNAGLLIVIAVVVGLVFMALFFVIISQLNKLAEDNSFKFSDTVNHTAEVYLTIPEKKTGVGQVLVSVHGSTHQLKAMTEEASIPSGAMVKVVGILNKDILIVENI